MSENLIAEIRLFVCLFSLKSALPARRVKSVLVGEASRVVLSRFSKYIGFRSRITCLLPMPPAPLTTAPESSRCLPDIQHLAPLLIFRKTLG